MCCFGFLQRSVAVSVTVEVAVLGPPVPNKPDGFCGRKVKLKMKKKKRKKKKKKKKKGFLAKQLGG